MSQKTGPANSRKLVIRVKVPRSSDIPTHTKNAKIRALILLPVGLFLAIGLGIWFWPSAQVSPPDLPLVKSSNHASEVIPEENVNISGENLASSLAAEKNSDTAELTSSAVSTSVKTTEVLEEKTETTVDIITPPVEKEKQSIKEEPPGVKTTVTSLQEPPLVLDENVISEKIETTQKAALNLAPTEVVDSKFVARAMFANKIQNREPVDIVQSQIEHVDEGLRRVYFFSELRSMKGKNVIHRWYHNDSKQFEIAFEIRGNRWRIYSSKRIVPARTGEWKVEIIDKASNEVLASRSFNYGTK